jgi:hypothetical protein
MSVLHRCSVENLSARNVGVMQVSTYTRWSGYGSEVVGVGVGSRGKTWAWWDFLASMQKKQCSGMCLMRYEL